MFNSWSNTNFIRARRKRHRLTTHPLVNPVAICWPPLKLNTGHSNGIYVPSTPIRNAQVGTSTPICLQTQKTPSHPFCPRSKCTHSMAWQAAYRNLRQLYLIRLTLHSLHPCYQPTPPFSQPFLLRHPDRSTYSSWTKWPQQSIKNWNYGVIVMKANVEANVGRVFFVALSNELWYLPSVEPHVSTVDSQWTLFATIKFRSS